MGKAKNITMLQNAVRLVFCTGLFLDPIIRIFTIFRRVAPLKLGFSSIRPNFGGSIMYVIKKYLK